MKPTIHAIQLAVCAEFQIAQSEMLGRSRKADIVRARHEAMLRARETGASFPKIGREFHRNHSTVIAACKKAIVNG
jgi:chromosomal replication initiator protein